MIPMQEGGSPFPPGDPEGVVKRLTEEERLDGKRSIDSKLCARA